MLATAFADTCNEMLYIYKINVVRHTAAIRTRNLLISFETMNHAVLELAATINSCSCVHSFCLSQFKHTPNYSGTFCCKCSLFSTIDLVDPKISYTSNTV